MSSAITALDVDAFIASVKVAVPSIQIQTDDIASLVIDDVTPTTAISAVSADDVRAVLAQAHRDSAAVVPWGGGQHVGLANIPTRYDVALSLTAMDRIIAHEPADMTVTVEPGVRLADLQRRLAEHGQVLPLDPACDGGATIGGILAANAGGPLQHAFGTARDWLIGLRVVHDDGSASKSGGRVVKNVAGYDMHKLHVGAHGSLGVIVEVTFKVAPLPATRRALAFACTSFGAACKTAMAAWDASLAIHRMEVLSPTAARSIAGESAWTLAIEAAGGEGAVRRSERDLQAIAARHGATVVATVDDAVWTRWSEAFRPRNLALRVAVLPSHVGDAVGSIIDATSASLPLSATVAAGVARARVDAIDDDEAVALVERLRRTMPRDADVAVEAATPAVKRQLDVFGAARSDFEIMRRLKVQFDPRGVLAPGRFLGRL